MSPRGKRLLAGLSSGVLIVAITAVLVARIPASWQQLPPNSAPLLVVLTHPTDESLWPADTPIPLTATVAGRTSIQKVEVWTDGRLFDAQSPPEGDQSFHGSWAWVPLTEGPHALFVRAVDGNGRTADSNVVHVHATAAAGMLAVASAQGGENLLDLAEQNGVPLEQLAAANPSVDPAAPVPPGTQLLIPVQPLSLPPTVSFPASEVSGPAQPADVGGPNGPSFLLERVLNPDALSPAAPSLSASVGVCNVTLTFQDNSDSEDGFYVYTLTDTSASFLRVASLAAHSGSGALDHVVQDQHGHVEFYVSAYNAGGESPSAPVAVEIASPQCDPAQGTQGDLQYIGGFLSLPPGVQLAYFYASINGGAWQRIPGDHEFLEPMAGQVDLRAKIQQLLGGQAMGEVDLDVWGWSGGALVYLGLIHINVNFASLAICDLGGGCSGDMGATHWVTEATVGSDQQNQTRAFRWRAMGPDITYAIWQVSTQPFPPGYSIGAPPGLVISGISEAEVNSQTGVAGGDFAIDFNVDLQLDTAQGAAPALERTSLQGLEFNEFESFMLPGLTDQWGSRPLPGALQTLLTQTLYVRLTPMAGGHPASDPSNSVVVTLQPTGPQPELHIYPFPTYSVEIVPDSYVNEVRVIQKLGILGCSVIAGVDHDAYIEWYTETMPAMLAFLAESSFQNWANHVGWTICPAIVELPEETWYEQLAGAFEAFWNNLASAIEQVKGALVDAIASIIPGCDPTCRSLLMTGLNFTITYFTGLPPSLPNFDAAVEMGVDYAVQMAISQAGIPYCDAACQELIAEQVQTAAAEIAASGRSQPGCSAQNHTLWVYEGATLYHLRPLCFPPGVFTQPVPGSMYEHGMVQARVTRIDSMPQSAPAQQLVLETHAVNAAYGDGHTEQAQFQIETYENCQYANGHYACAWVVHPYNYTITFSAPLEGTPYSRATVVVPALQPGQSVVIPVVFDADALDYHPPNVYEPRLAAILSAFPGIDVQTIPVDWWRDFVHMTDSTAQITITGRVLCQDPSLPLLWISPCSEPGSRQFTVP